MIPVCQPTLQGNEAKYVQEAIASGWISSAGKFIEEFEQKFAAYCTVKHAISCCNGTAALHMALRALGIGKGDEVIVPTFTMSASANAVVYTGAKPVFVDSELETWNLDIDKIEAKISLQTKAIMIVHTYGHPVDMDRLRQIAEKHHLPIIEDAAEAHGAEYKGRKAGSLGDIACFSFYANKIITTGEGGMVVTNNNHWADRCRKLRNHFFGQPRFLHEEVGFNYRMTNVQAAIGLAQLERVETYVAARRKNAQLYTSLLKSVPGITTPPEKPWAKNVYWMYGVLVQDTFGMSMLELADKLAKKGIETRTFFINMHKQPMYQTEEYPFHDRHGHYPAAEELEKKGIYLPSSSHLTEQEIHQVVQAIKDIHHGH